MNKETSKYVQTAMHLYCDKTGKPLISVFGDGSVDISADVTLDEAATAFWNAVRKIFDRHVTPASETELRAIHVTAVADVMTADKTLQPEVDGWWPLYLRSVLSQASRPWFTATAKDEKPDDEVPDAYQYKFRQPAGNTVWRDSPNTWNGQQPSGSRGLFARPQGEDLRQKLKDAQFAIDALHIVRHALGLPPGSNVTTDVVQAALDTQLEATGRANMIIVDLVNGVRDVLSRHRITVAAEPTLHESIDAADAFVFSREVAPADTTRSEAARDVICERRRQIKGEGRSIKHDDQNNGGDLAAAASAYALNAACQLNPYSQQPLQEFPIMWPSDWASNWWKPKTPRQDLVRAGALILAEIERLDRDGGENAVQ